MPKTSKGTVCATKEEKRQLLLKKLQEKIDAIEQKKKKSLSSTKSNDKDDSLIEREEDSASDMNNDSDRESCANDGDTSGDDGDSSADDGDNNADDSDSSADDSDCEKHNDITTANAYKSSAKTVGSEMDAIREEISSLTPAQRQQLKEKLGEKMYTEVILGRTVTVDKVSGREMQKFHKRRRSRPLEMSSKIPVKRLGVKNAKNKVTHRDPRFDSLSGEYNEELFKRSYGFLDELKEREEQKLKKKAQKTKNQEERRKIQLLLHKKQSLQEAERKQQARKEKVAQHRKAEKVRIAEGKKPYYKKKSELKAEELVDKFRELKKSGKLQKYMQKKRKRNAQKDRRHLPT